MEKPEFIEFDNVIVRTDAIVDVERPTGENGELTHVVVTLNSGRTIDTTCPTKEVADARYNLFKELFAPENWDVRTPVSSASNE